MATVRNFELMEQLEYLDFDNMIKVLDEKESIVNYAYIVHDKDVREDGTLKPPHVHCFVRLEGPRDINQIAKWFNVEMQHIQKCRSKFNNCLKYLIHANDPSKYQYDIQLVKSNYDFVKEMNQLSDSERLENIIELIGSMEITRYNYTEKITIHEITKWKQKIETAFKYVDDRLRKEVDRNMEVIYIQGVSGSGKTTYSKRIASNKGYSVFVSGSSNDVLDGYCGEECIILDDIRPSVMGLSDLLKMLDNNTNSTTRSRFYNKVMTRCRLIVITTVLDIDTFFNNVFENENEPIIQLKRRCKTKIRMDKNEMYVSYFDKSLNDYSNEFVCENPVKDLIKKSIIDEKEVVAHLNEFLGVKLSKISYESKFEQATVEDIEMFKSKRRGLV